MCNTNDYNKYFCFLPKHARIRRTFLPLSSGKEHSLRHVKVVFAAVVREASARFRLELVRRFAVRRDFLQLLQIGDFRLGILQVLRRVVRRENQIEALRLERLKLGDDCVGVSSSGDNRMAVVSHHVRVDRVDFRNLDVERFLRLFDDKADSADFDFFPRR